jgi:hypothetical protein
MIKRRRGLFFVAALFLMFLFFQNALLVSGASSSGKISWDYHGSWYSKGFVEYTGWKNFMDLFFDSLLGLEVVEVDGKVGLKGINIYGNEFVNTDLVSFDKQNGILSYSINITLPLLGFKEIRYNISLNNEKNLNRVINPNDYYNGTIEDILWDLNQKNIKISLIGEKSNITLVPNGSGKFELSYLKNINESDTKPIIVSGSSVQTNTSADKKVYENNGLNDSKGFDTLVKANDTQINRDEKLEIINPIPASSDISMFIRDKKKFSIDNSDYDSISWYLDGKKIKENSKFYDFSVLKVGDYVIKINVKKGDEIKTRVWNVNVKEKIEKSKSILKNKWFYWIMGIIIVLIILMVVFMIFRKDTS